MIHLDTSFLVDYLRESARHQPGPATALFEGLGDNEEPTVSVFVLCELYAGAELFAKPSQEMERIDKVCSYLNVDHPGEEFAPAYGRLLARLTRSGHTVSTMDLLIATSAVISEAPLITRNIKDFVKIPGLKVMGY